MTLEEQKSISSDETEPSKPWTAVVALGKKIVDEFGLTNSVDTLGRWMAHRIAELIERADQAETDEGKESARRECSDLIIRLWERRTHWPYGQPLAEMAEFLKNLTTNESSYFQQYGQTEPHVDNRSWIGILPQLIRLGDREIRVCRDAALADINIEEERAWLIEHPDELSTEEREIIEQLQKLRERLDGPYYKLDNAYIQNFTSLTSEERTDLVLETLKKIGTEREKLLSLIHLPKNRSLKRKEIINDASSKGRSPNRKHNTSKSVSKKSRKAY